MFCFWFLRGKFARGCQKMYPFAHALRLTALLIFARIMFMNCSRFYSAISGGLFEISKYLIIITEERRRRCSVWRIFEGVFQRGEHINNYLIPPLVHMAAQGLWIFLKFVSVVKLITGEICSTQFSFWGFKPEAWFKFCLYFQDKSGKDAEIILESRLSVKVSKQRSEYPQNGRLFFYYCFFKSEAFFKS